MRKYGLIGFPLGHSFSAGYFADKFTREGVDAVYTNYPLQDIAELERLIGSEKELQGLNVTVPYKRAVITYLDVLARSARHIRAVNTIVCCRRDGRLTLIGHNTDIHGFRKSLEEHLKAHHQSALVLGTGGSSAAVTHVLEELGMDYLMVSRRPGPGVIRYQDLDPSILKDRQVVINTTPLGMHPDTGSSPGIPYQALTSSHLLFDLVYNPPKTTFLQRGESRGATVVNGYDMLVYQAEASWEIWNRVYQEKTG